MHVARSFYIYKKNNVFIQLKLISVGINCLQYEWYNHFFRSTKLWRPCDRDSKCVVICSCFLMMFSNIFFAWENSLLLKLTKKFIKDIYINF